MSCRMSSLTNCNVFSTDMSNLQLDLLAYCGIEKAMHGSGYMLSRGQQYSEIHGQKAGYNLLLLLNWPLAPLFGMEKGTGVSMLVGCWPSWVPNAIRDITVKLLSSFFQICVIGGFGHECKHIVMTVQVCCCCWWCMVPNGMLTYDTPP